MTIDQPGGAAIKQITYLGKEVVMYIQSGKRFKRDFYHWRSQERLEELEQFLESDYLAYIDPNIAEDMKRIIQKQKRAE